MDLIKADPINYPIYLQELANIDEAVYTNTLRNLATIHSKKEDEVTEEAATSQNLEFLIQYKAR